MLLLAFRTADWVLGFSANDIGSVSANDAPAIGTCRQVYLVKDIDRGNLVVFSLQHCIELKVGYAFSENILLRLLVLIFFVLCSWLSRLTTSLLTSMLAHFTFDRVNACLV